MQLHSEQQLWQPSFWWSPWIRRWWAGIWWGRKLESLQACREKGAWAAWPCMTPSLSYVITDIQLLQYILYSVSGDISIMISWSIKLSVMISWSIKLSDKLFSFKYFKMVLVFRFGASHCSILQGNQLIRFGHTVRPIIYWSSQKNKASIHMHHGHPIQKLTTR